VSGTKFYYLKNEAVLLELALINWTLSQLLSKGFVPLSTPDLVRSTVVEKCGFQPRGQNTQVSPPLHLPLQTRVLSYSANC
jgi:seryl-tRNA synthetase